MIVRIPHGMIVGVDIGGTFTDLVLSAANLEGMERQDAVRELFN
jgi:N-methylhydantoinase A/oxoprolinase/acetone carboxylase beta subunit